MSKNDDINLDQLGTLIDPLKDWPELKDILDPVTGRLIGKFGVPGFKIEEAAALAENWWNKAARYQMPDYRKPLSERNAHGINSGILNGNEWQYLNRGEKIQVVKIWHEEIGIPKHGMGFVNVKDYQNELRKFDLERIFGSKGLTH